MGECQSHETAEFAPEMPITTTIIFAHLWWGKMTQHSRRSLVRGQEVPDGGVLDTEDPRAETLKAAVFDQRIAFAEGMDVSVEDPFGQVIAM
jgi:hypothetical protein